MPSFTVLPGGIRIFDYTKFAEPLRDQVRNNAERLAEVDGLQSLSSSQISRHLKRLRVHGLIERIAHRYKYYVTPLGRRAIITGLELRELFVLPQLASNTP